MKEVEVEEPLERAEAVGLGLASMEGEAGTEGTVGAGPVGVVQFGWPDSRTLMRPTLPRRG